MAEKQDKKPCMCFVFTVGYIKNDKIANNITFTKYFSKRAPHGGEFRRLGVASENTANEKSRIVASEKTGPMKKVANKKGGKNETK